LQYLREHGFAAQERRRTEIGNTFGVSLPDMRTHLFKEMPELKAFGMDLRTVGHLMVPPRENTAASKKYHRVIPARIGRKRNDIRKKNNDAHYTMAQVKLIREFGSLFAEEVLTTSMDTMNTIHMGCTAVSRYHQLHKYFLEDDMPDFNDHGLWDCPFVRCTYLSRSVFSLADFGAAGYNLKCTGVLVCERKAADNHAPLRESAPAGSVPTFADDAVLPFINRKATEFCRLYDASSRDHFDTPHTGPLHLYLQAPKGVSRTGRKMKPSRKAVEHIAGRS
jgi:hypothetical protein